MTRSMALPLGIASANLLVETFYASMTGGEHVAEVCRSIYSLKGLERRCANVAMNQIIF